MLRSFFIFQFLLGFGGLLAFLAGINACGESLHFSEEKTYRHWGRLEGLPNENVTALLQTHDGFLWVGTAGGLVRFDGVRFKGGQLKTASGKSNLAITSLCEDDSHRLWIGTANDGLFWCRNDPANHLPFATNSTGTAINSLAVDRNACLWVGTSDGLRRLNLTNLSWMPSPAGLTNEFVTSVNVARSGTVWITTHNGMNQYRDDKLTAVDFQAEALNRDPEPIGIYEDLSGNLWAFGDTYLVNMNEGKRFNYFRTGGASSLRIWSLSEGRRGQLWIGTSGQGLFSFADGKFRPLALREGRLPSDVRAICEDNEENLWLGTHGGGLIRLRSHPEQVFDTASGLPDEGATCIATNFEGAVCVGFKRAGLFTIVGERWENLCAQRLINSAGFGPGGATWLGTQGSGLVCAKDGRTTQFSTASGLASDVVPVVAVETNGVIWAGTSAGTIHRLEHDRIETFGREEGLGEAAISALIIARSGNLLVGDAAGEIFEQQGQRFERIADDVQLKGAGILSLEEADDGRLWIGTEGSGIACLWQNKIKVWDVAHGFPDNTVYGILSETNGIVWAATGKGVFRLNGFSSDATSAAQTGINLILEADASGRQYPVQGFPSACRSGDGRLWFLLPGRVVSLDPRSVPMSTPPLPVYIDQISANGSPVPAANSQGAVILPSDLTGLEIQFTALDFAEPERIRFQHKLDGFDTDWIEGSAERRVLYGRLPYGNYLFHLRACRADGIWNESRLVKFEHPAPPWRSATAIVAYVFAALFGAALIARVVSHRRLRLKLSSISQQQTIEKERMRIAQNMHDELGSKLTKISYLTELVIRDESASKENVHLIANTSRDLLQTLDEIVWAVNPRNDSLEHLAAYLGHYANEYFQNTPIELRMDLAFDLPAMPLSAETRHNLFLAFQEALGNVLKHAQASRVQIGMHIENTHFAIVIADNGQGFDVEASSKIRRVRGGNGLQNIRHRLADIGGEFFIKSAPHQGVSVTLRIKLTTAILS